MYQRNKLVHQRSSSIREARPSERLAWHVDDFASTNTVLYNNRVTNTEATKVAKKYLNEASVLF